MLKGETIATINRILDPNVPKEEATEICNEALTKLSEEGSFFRKLDSDEDQQFRDWARNNIEDLKWRETNSTLGILHPVVRDEWEKIKSEQNSL